MRFILARKRNTDDLSSNGPSHGVYHGIQVILLTTYPAIQGFNIQETTLSDTSSIFSTGSTSYSSSTANRLSRFSNDDDPNNSPRIKTPNPPMNWREGRCLGRGMFGHVRIIESGEIWPELDKTLNVVEFSDDDHLSNFFDSISTGLGLPMFKRGQQRAASCEENLFEQSN